ncbi:DUF4446 family protein [Candidatus Saccharibacteria bacterium]|nr:DUF4446 family protein [Candidatus Saccharibacteria bacterium]
MIILTILFCLSLIALGYTQWRFMQLQKKYGEFLEGADAKKVEQLIKGYSHDVKDSLQKLDELAGFTAKMHTQSQFAISKQALIRFNPFGDTGGDQSFVLVLLDNHNNGVITSSVHARTGTRVYAKEITNGLSKYNLSDEETVALQKALNSKKKQESTT